MFIYWLGVSFENGVLQVFECWKFLPHTLDLRSSLSSWFRSLVFPGRVHSLIIHPSIIGAIDLRTYCRSIYEACLTINDHQSQGIVEQNIAFAGTHIVFNVLWWAWNPVVHCCSVEAVSKRDYLKKYKMVPVQNSYATVHHHLQMAFYDAYQQIRKRPQTLNITVRLINLLSWGHLVWMRHQPTPGQSGCGANDRCWGSSWTSWRETRSQMGGWRDGRRSLSWLCVNINQTIMGISSPTN